MDYKTALIITKGFVNNTAKKDYTKTTEEMVAYGEACAYLKKVGA